LHQKQVGTTQTYLATRGYGFPTKGKERNHVESRKGLGQGVLEKSKSLRQRIGRTNVEKGNTRVRTWFQELESHRPSITKGKRGTNQDERKFRGKQETERNLRHLLRRPGEKGVGGGGSSYSRMRKIQSVGGGPMGRK